MINGRHLDQDFISALAAMSTSNGDGFAALANFVEPEFGTWASTVDAVLRPASGPDINTTVAVPVPMTVVHMTVTYKWAEVQDDGDGTYTVFYDEVV